MAEAIGAGFRNMDVAFGPQLRFPRPARRTWLDRLPQWRPIRQFGAWFLGAAPARLVRLFIKPFLLANMSPSFKLFANGAMLVSTEGRAIDTGNPTDNLALAPGATGFIVMTEATARKFDRQPYYISTAPGVAFAYYEDYRRGRPDVTHLAPDAATLAAKLGVPADALADSMRNLGAGPFVALGPVWAALTILEGGLAVDRRMQVLNADNQVIPGLFAAGGVGQGGTLLKGHGLHLAWAFTSGRLAGKFAAAKN